MKNPRIHKGLPFPARPGVEPLEARLVPGESFGLFQNLASLLAPVALLSQAFDQASQGDPAASDPGEVAVVADASDSAPDGWAVDTRDLSVMNLDSAGAVTQTQADTTGPSRSTDMPATPEAPAPATPAPDASLRARAFAEDLFADPFASWADKTEQAGGSYHSQATPAPLPGGGQAAPPVSLSGTAPGGSAHGAVFAPPAGTAAGAPVAVQPLGHGHGGGGGGGGGGGTPIGYTPAQIRHAYGFDQLAAGTTGSGTTIAIVDAYNDPTITTDVAAFDTKFGLPSINLTVENQTGGSSLPLSNSQWYDEISLDVEWAHAIAPGANIILIEANSSSYSDLLTGVRTGATQAQVVSMSWGSSEFSSETGASYDGVFSAYPNVSFVVASGDSGVVEYPSSSPYVLSVGGTTLPLDSSGNLTGAETSWSGSGGGASAYEAVPGYQSGFYAGATRGTPDVSYDANPSTGYAIYVSGAWLGTQIGGTSAGAPQWSALIALADQSRLTAGKLPLSTTSLTSRAEYTAAGASVYSSNFRDISPTGYDLVTGLGSPLANNLVPYLASLP